MLEKAKKQKRIWESRRFKVMLYCAITALVVGSTATFAWYGVKERKAQSLPAEVMKPYYLNLRNPSDTADLQLSIGNLFPGDTKQIVFCVSNKKNESIGLDMGVTSFEYAIELIYTQNLALDYKIYELKKAEAGTVGAFAVLDQVPDGNGGTVENVTYWLKKTGENGAPLTGNDLSTDRHSRVGLTPPLPVNAGKYISYTESTDKDNNGNPIKLRLEAGTDAQGNPTFDSQFFLIEINWQTGADVKFEQYEKETDMICLLVEALQPKPEKKGV